MAKSSKDLFYLALGKKIAEHRKLVKLTQHKLAELVALSRASIVNIEKGRQQPSVFLLCHIARHLKIGIDKLIPDLYDHELTDDLFKRQIEQELGKNPKAKRTFKKFMLEIKSS